LILHFRLIYGIIERKRNALKPTVGACSHRRLADIPVGASPHPTPAAAINCWHLRCREFNPEKLKRVLLLGGSELFLMWLPLFMRL